MTYTIRDNNGNVVFSIENVNPDVSFESINNELRDLNEYSNKLNKSIESFNIISDAKAMEAFGYVKGAGFKENIKAVSKEIWKKIQEFFKKIRQIFINFGNWIVSIFNKIKAHFDKKKVKEGAEILSEACKGSKTVDEVAEKLNKEYEEKLKEYEEKHEEYEKISAEYSSKRNLTDELSNKLKKIEEFKDYHINLKKMLVLGRKTPVELYELRNILNTTDIFPLANDIKDDTNRGLFELNSIVDIISHFLKIISKDNETIDKVLSYIAEDEFVKNIKKRVEIYDAFDKESDSFSESELIKTISNINSFDISDASYFQFGDNLKKNIDKASKLCDEFCKIADNIPVTLDKISLDKEKEINQCTTVLYSVINTSQVYLKYYIDTSSKMISEMTKLIEYLMNLADIKEQMYNVSAKLRTAYDNQNNAYNNKEKAFADKEKALMYKEQYDIQKKVNKAISDFKI